MSKILAQSKSFFPLFFVKLRKIWNFNETWPLKKHSYIMLIICLSRWKKIHKNSWLFFRWHEQEFASKVEVYDLVCSIGKSELEFPEFFKISSTLNSHNFFHIEPILKFFDVLKSYVSETFISGVYVVRGHDLPPPPIANVKGFSAKSQNPHTKWSAPPYSEWYFPDSCTSQLAVREATAPPYLP